MTTYLAIKKLSKIRVQLLFDDQFFGILAVCLHLVEAEVVDTMVATGKNLYFNANFVLSSDVRLLRNRIRMEILYTIDHNFSDTSRRSSTKSDCKIDYSEGSQFMVSRIISVILSMKGSVIPSLAKEIVESNVVVLNEL